MLIGLFVFLAGWALASPVGSSPDEDYHLASIWCAQGDRELACDTTSGPSGDGVGYGIPAGVYEAACFAKDRGTTAGCQTTSLVTDGQDLRWTERGNFGVHAGDYPPLFYQTMSVFVGPDAERSVIVMRLVNALILTVMLGVTYAASTVRARRALVVTVGVTIVPLGAFIIPSINPSSWATISAMTLFLAVMGYLQAATRRQMATLGAVSVASLVLAAGSRADASMYSVIAIGAAVLLGVTLRQVGRETILRLILPVVLATVAATSFLTAGQAAGAATQDAGRSPLAFFLGFADIFRFWVEALGATKLGWLDTPMPSIVWLPVTASFFAVIFVAIATISVRRGIVVALVALSAAAIPTYIETVAEVQMGSVQARYVYPLLILLLAVAALSTERRAFTLTPVQRWFVVSTITLGNGIAIYKNIKRYVAEISDGKLFLSPGDWWWTNVPIPAEVVCVVAAVGFGVAFVCASRVLVDQESSIDDHGTHDSVAVPDGAPAHEDEASRVRRPALR